MTGSVSTRRSLLAAAGILAGGAALLSQSPQPDPAFFLKSYNEAWSRHDSHAIAMLHTEDVLVVNRFGSIVEGRAELERVMAFLHGPDGPFHAVNFPRQEPLISRILYTNMVTLHAKWKNPTMGPEDQLAHGGESPWVDLISTYLLTHKSGTWQIIQHDLHSVEPIKFPFKTKWNG